MKTKCHFKVCARWFGSGLHGTKRHYLVFVCDNPDHHHGRKVMGMHQDSWICDRDEFYAEMTGARR